MMWRSVHVTWGRTLLAGYCALIVGCGNLSAPPADTFYRLTATSSQTAAAQVLGSDGAKGVYVPPFATTGLHSERALVYAHGDGHTLHQYQYHFWVDSPRKLLQRATVDALQQAGVGGVVMDAISRPAYVVKGELRRFERSESEQGDDAMAVAVIVIRIYRGGGGLALFEREYQRTIAPSGEGVSQFVDTLDQATSAILNDFVRDSAEVLVTADVTNN